MFRDYELECSDDELYVYDQSCDNCCNRDCPMKLPETAEEHLEFYGSLADFDEEEAKAKLLEVMRYRKEDAIVRDDNPTWCIYWQGRKDRR